MYARQCNLDKNIIVQCSYHVTFSLMHTFGMLLNVNNHVYITETFIRTNSASP